MTSGNRYFRFDRPVRWFRPVGTSDTNTYLYGRSRVIDTVYAQSLIEPGDVVHRLSGSTYLVRADGTVESGRFNLPKPPLEKTYGFPQTDLDFLEAMVKQRLCAEISQPGTRTDYGAGRTLSETRQFPDCTGPVTGEGAVPSPVMDTLNDAMRDSAIEATIQSLGGQVRRFDVGLSEDPTSLDARLRIEFPEYRQIELSLSPLWDRMMIKVQGLPGVMAGLANPGPTDPTLNIRSERFADATPAEASAILRRIGRMLEACLAAA